MRVWNANHVPVQLSVHAIRLRKRQSRILEGTWYLSRNPSKATTPIKIAMMPVEDRGDVDCCGKEYQEQSGTARISHRWGIETLFSALKTRGLGLENMHITAPRKLATLMSALATAI